MEAKTNKARHLSQMKQMKMYREKSIGFGKSWTETNQDYQFDTM